MEMIPIPSGWRRYALVEPPLMFFLFSLALCGSVTTDLMLYRSCQALIPDKKNSCHILHTNASSKEALDLEAQIQPYASYILMWMSLIQGIVPAILSFFLGPWSDKHGRKPLMIAGYVGSTVSWLLWTFLSTKELNPWLYILPSIPTALVGGYCGIVLATFCFVTDISNNSERAWHLTWVQASVSTGLFLGTIAGRFVFKQFGYTVLYACAAVCSTFSTLHVLFCVPESVVRGNQQGSWCSLFDLSLVKDMIITCTKKREGFDRSVAWCCMFCFAIYAILLEGSSMIGYLFTSARLGWGVDEATTYLATTIVLSVVGILLGGRLFRLLIDDNMEDTSITVIAAVSAFAGSIGKSLTTKSWHIYLASCLAMFSDLSIPTLRAVLSKAAPKEDAGKVFSLTMSLEAVLPLAATPLFTLIYSHNLPPVYPSPIYLFIAALNTAVLFAVVLMDRFMRNSPNPRYNTVGTETQDAD